MCATVSTCFFPAFAHLAHTSSRLLRVLCSGVAHGNMRAMVCNSRLLLLQGTAAFASHLPITSLLSPCLRTKSASNLDVAGKVSFLPPHSFTIFIILPVWLSDIPSSHASPHFLFVHINSIFSSASSFSPFCSSSCCPLPHSKNLLLLLLLLENNCSYYYCHSIKAAAQTLDACIYACV